MAEGGVIIAENVPDSLVMMAMIVILVPFVTGFILTFLRIFEIRRGKKLGENLSGWIGTGGLGISWVASIVVAVRYFTEYVDLEGHIEKVVVETPFLPQQDSAFQWGIMLDPLSVIFLVALTTIASLIHFYAMDYMHGDSAYTRFFGAMNLFTGSMLGFVLASNLFASFIFWELLGFTSYLLIGYFWPKRSASHAARKAFMYNKIGDVSFVFAMGFIANEFAKKGLTLTFNYAELENLVNHGDLEVAKLALPAFLLFGAAIGKSAQVPLFGWLPEAMEGPTPVSALLHSSTMVKAGLLLIARTFFTFYGSGFDLHHFDPAEVGYLIGNIEFFNPGSLIAWFGTFTALMGAMMALTATDIKKLLAFSTISQLGYIALAIGSGGVTAGFYHLLSHATFKSLLFLGAGAVIHSVHSQEMADMGGLRTKMPATFWTMLVGALGLMGLPLMNGFWSKDAVLLALHNADWVVGNTLLYWIAVLTAAITAFYSVKLIGLTFTGEGRYDKDHVEPGPTSTKMKWALIILGSAVVVESLWFSIGTIFFGENHESIMNFEHALGTMLGVHGDAFAFGDAVPSILAVLIGGTMSFFIYVRPMPAMVNLTSLSITDMIAKVSLNRFGMDKMLYSAAEGSLQVSKAGAYVDKEIIDGIIINTWVRDYAGLGTAKLSREFDEKVIDGTVKWFSNLVSDIAGNLRELQSGVVSNYAKYMVVGLVVILSYFALDQFIDLPFVG